jgi:predicted O-methyltransferase YrrM
MTTSGQPVLEKTSRRFWGAGARLQPWLSSAAALREDPGGWWRSLLYRTSGRIVKPFLGLPSVSLSWVAGAVEHGKDPIMDGICMPPFFGSDAHDDFRTLMGIVGTIQPNIVVELGTAYGNTVANICRECPNARVYTVNASAEDMGGKLTTYGLATDEIGSVYKRYGFGDRVVQIYCDTLKLDLSGYLAGAVIDLAIIDACHDPMYVVNDFLKVVPYMRPHGIVLLHDTHPSMRHHLWGSYVGCMILRRQGYDIGHIADTWWGVWRKAGE